MVQRVPAALVVVPLDQREVGHPERAASRPPAIRPKRPASSSRSAPSVWAATPASSATSSSRSPGEASERGRRSPQLLLGEELRDRRAPAAALLDVCPDEPARALALGELDQPVELRAGQLVRAGVDPAHHAAALEHAAEDLELRVAQRVAEVADLEAEPHVGAVGAEARDRLVVGAGAGTACSSSTPPAANAASRTPSVTAITSSSCTNAISMSSWVNSSWRSARSASSRKQRAIW